MTEKDEAFIGAVTTEDMQRIMGKVTSLSPEFNKTSPLPLALRQDIIRSLLKTKKITPEKGVSETMIMDAVAQQKDISTREMISYLVKKKLATEPHRAKPGFKPG